MRRDGNWWRTVGPASKNGYIAGFFDGLVLGRNFSYWRLNGKDGKLDTAEADRVMDAYDESYNVLINTTNGQFVEGLDKFYNDYRNRRIMVFDAVWIVARSISGASDKELEIQINNFRKKAGTD